MPKSPTRIRRLERENARLRTLIFRDELTGLLNRRGFKGLVGKLFAEIRWQTRYKNKRKSFKINSLGILFLDLDRFKSINDRYGHKAGDKALQHTASLINKRIRGIDVVGRWGGEEIVIALLGADERASKITAEDIREIIHTNPLRLGGRKIYLSASIGAAGYKNERTLEDLIEKADRAMYIAKKKRNAVATLR